MRLSSRLKKVLVGGAVALALSSGTLGIYYSKKTDKKLSGLENKIEQYQNEQDLKLTQSIDSIKEYISTQIDSAAEKNEEWVKEKYEPRVPLEEFEKVYKTVYEISTGIYYENDSGKIEYMGSYSGSGILFKDGYFLTAKHVIDDSDLPRDFEDLKYHHKELTLGEEMYKLEELIVSEKYDYALLKLSKDDRREEWSKLPSYKKWFNLPKDVKIGMKSIAMGYSNGIKNLRLGNLSETNKEGIMCGKEYYGFANDIIPGDSGGPLFVIEDGEIKLAAIASALYMMPDFSVPFIRHPTNIGCGLRADVIMEDIKAEVKKKKTKK